MIIILDTTILTLLITKSTDSEEAKQCQDWFFGLIARGGTFKIPEICDYEVRRGFIFLEKRTEKNQKDRKKNLENIREYSDCLPFTINISKIAAELWAESTIAGKTQPKGVSADLLIIAHAISQQDEFPSRKIIISTKNIDDFIIFQNQYPSLSILN